MQFTTPYTPQRNGLSERVERTVVQVTFSMPSLGCWASTEVVSGGDAYGNTSGQPTTPCGVQSQDATLGAVPEGNQPVALKDNRSQSICTNWDKYREALLEGFGTKT